jgi:hypothetical protein
MGRFAALIWLLGVSYAACMHIANAEESRDSVYTPGFTLVVGLVTKDSARLVIGSGTTSYHVTQVLLSPTPTNIRLTINGRQHGMNVSPAWTLMW